MGTFVLTAPLVAELFLYAHGQYFLKTLHKKRRNDDLKCLYGTSRYLHNILNIDNPFLEKKLIRNDTIGQTLQTQKHSFWTKIINGENYTSVNDIRENFEFNIVNFPWLDGDVPRIPYTTPKLSDDAPGIIKVGDKAIDDHCMRSTMDPEIALMVDKFRQLKLREFCEINKLCQLQGVSLSPALLERVLLYPPDKPHSAISHAVKTPGAPLLSSHYADPPKRPKTPIEVKHKDRVRRSKSGKLLIDSRHQYPQGRSVAATATKANLSTGRAFIRRKVDCWMTFEEYDKLTSHLAIRYQQLHGSSDNNAFWPGHLLDKIKLCMPPYDKPLDVDKMDMSGVVFHNTRDRIPSNLGKTRENSAWPINESGYIQSGMYDRFERSFIHND